MESGSDSDSSDSSLQEQQHMLSRLATFNSMYMDRNINMVSQGTTSLVNTTEYYNLIFDTGADTSVIGKGWHVTQYYGSKVNLVGFNETNVRKRDLKICTAVTIIEHLH